MAKGESIFLDNVLYISVSSLECGIHGVIETIKTEFHKFKSVLSFCAMSLRLRLRVSLIPAEPHSAATSTKIPNNHPELRISLRHPRHGRIATFYPVALSITESCRPAPINGIFLNYNLTCLNARP